MIQAIISDFSRVILFPKDKNYLGELNAMHRNILKEKTSYNVYDYYYFNEELLDFYKSLKPKRKMIIFTSGIVQEHPQIQEKLLPIFDQIYSVEYLQLPKSESNSYKKLCEKIEVVPNETLFIDDAQKNIDAAKRAGLQTLPFSNTAEVKRMVATII